MSKKLDGAAPGLKRFDDPNEAIDYAISLYDKSVQTLRKAFEGIASGKKSGPVDACYPRLRIAVDRAHLNVDARHSHGVILEPGVYETTLTRPDLFDSYYREQLSLIMRRHGVPVEVGPSDRQIPLPYVVEQSVVSVDETTVRALEDHFALPDLAVTDDDIANGDFVRSEDAPRPLALFSAERVDYSLARLRHYTGSSPRYVQRFILLTNYQRYVHAFIDWGRQMLEADEGYDSFVAPGDTVTRVNGQPEGAPPPHLPQMPAYHLTRPDGDGITLVNIGVGPSNAKTITDHLAVLRPHCWLMVGHCAGLRRSQLLGDYVLAHGYLRDDHVLDQDLPPWSPIPPFAEVQQALQVAVAQVTGLSGRDMKTRMRTGTVATTDNRNWELRVSEFFGKLNQSRSIAVDMESATIAANGFRFRVPYGTLLCVSDKPLHGELKLGGVANAFYRQRVGQHLAIGLETMRLLREQGVDRLHSRKLRGFDEPAFR